jgi:hypothetical protein
VTAFAVQTPELLNAATAHKSAASHFAAVHDHFSASLQQIMGPSLQSLIRSVDERLFPIQKFHAGSTQAPDRLAINGSCHAREVAEEALVTAARQMEMSGNRGYHGPDGLDPQTVLALAELLIETGQIPNYLRAAELGRTVTSWYGDARPASAGPAARAWGQLYLSLVGALERLWQRAPLLILLAGWLVAGVAARVVLWCLSVPTYEVEAASYIWDTGFLALVVFQFLATVRSAFMRTRL